eukprot:m.173694 g.173694  ORF g.173694 m.173694 type:complete len:316 (-) comp16533_c12_seq3:303-1250(-)
MDEDTSYQGLSPPYDDLEYLARFDFGDSPSMFDDEGSEEQLDQALKRCRSTSPCSFTQQPACNMHDLHADPSVSQGQSTADLLGDWWFQDQQASKRFLHQDFQHMPSIADQQLQEHDDLFSTVDYPPPVPSILPLPAFVARDMESNEADLLPISEPSRSIDPSPTDSPMSYSSLESSLSSQNGDDQPLSEEAIEQAIQADDPSRVLHLIAKDPGLPLGQFRKGRGVRYFRPCVLQLDLCSQSLFLRLLKFFKANKPYAKYEALLSCERKTERDKQNKRNSRNRQKQIPFSLHAPPLPRQNIPSASRKQQRRASRP